MTKLILKNQISEAAGCLRRGGTVVFPTETVYGLGADANNSRAVAKIFEAKGRPADNPLIVHIAKRQDVYKIAAEILPEAEKLMDAFWPGSLTLIFKKSDNISENVTAGLDTVAVRMPRNQIASALILESGVFVAAPSANLSGSPSPTNVNHVIEDLYGRVDYIIDGEDCEIGIESTVLNVSQKPFTILRPGAVTYEDLVKVTDCISGEIADAQTTGAPRCPGMKYTHYSPKASVIVVSGSLAATTEYIQKKLDQKRVPTGVLAYMGTQFDNADLVLDAGSDMKAYAAGLYRNLREFDKHGIDTVYAQFEELSGIGIAVKNRIYKSAGYHVVKV